MRETTQESPQRRARCACPSWTTARQCYCLRHAPDDTEPKDEECECACHEPDEDDGYDEHADYIETIGRDDDDTPAAPAGQSEEVVCACGDRAVSHRQDGDRACRLCPCPGYDPAAPIVLYPGATVGAHGPSPREEVCVYCGLPDAGYHNNWTDHGFTPTRPAPGPAGEGDRTTDEAWLRALAERYDRLARTARAECMDGKESPISACSTCELAAQEDDETAARLRALAAVLARITPEDVARLRDDVRFAGQHSYAVRLCDVLDALAPRAAGETER